MGLPIHFVADPQGWCCVGVIFLIWLYNTVFIPKLILFPRFEEGHVTAAEIWAYYITSLFCVVSLLRASTADPGKLQDSPKIPLTGIGCSLQTLINNCVGEDNHWLFLQLCFYTQLLSGYTLILDFCHYYYFLPMKAINWDLFVFRHELALLRISTFMGIVMFGGMCSLFYTQVVGILTVSNNLCAATFF
ncbi:hypothetical protein GDO78_006862 [Eleutherodactylus coqui]|uniref:Palmitoyltransferase n=1 Tax=Eleutherodactylus coqui TaxID=57060 RepID=A0A8J6FH96_ELECQ|nr:hypothetical protein GDO78_006862 [Eleutherodactylus coqui]